MPPMKPKPTPKPIKKKTVAVKKAKSSPANTSKKGNNPGPFFTGVGGRLMGQSERAGRYADIKMQKESASYMKFINSKEYKKNLGKTSRKVK